MKDFLNQDPALVLSIEIGLFMLFTYFLLSKFYFKDKPIPRTAKDELYAKAIARYVQLAGLIDQVKTDKGVEYMAGLVVDFENYYTNMIDPVKVQMMTRKLYDRLHDRQAKILSVSSN